MRAVMHGVVLFALSISGLGAQERQALAPAARQYVSIDAPVLALTHVRLIDGTGGPVREDQTVVITGSRISTVGPSASTTAPADAEVIDLRGHTLIPGLVQLHEHMWFGGVAQSTPMSLAGPMLYFALGVTSAMTAGTQFPYHDLNLRKVIDAGLAPGPRIHITGPYMTGGVPRQSANRIITSPDEARRVIAYWADEGATWFKFLGEGSLEVLGAAIDEAHKRGLRVTGHLCSITFTEAAALGIDALQHGFITNSDYVPGKRPGVCPPENMRIQADVDVESPEVRRSIERIVGGGAAVVSTLGVYETFSPSRARLDPRAMEMLKPGTRKEVEANHRTIAESGLIVPERLLEKMMRWERAFVAAGGLLGSGSDPWGTGFLPGFGNLRNYELLIEAGFTPPEAVRILTLNGARILGQDERLGSVEPGKVADLVVIRGNPAGTASDIYEVITVFKDGIGFDSVKLREAARGTIGPG